MPPRNISLPNRPDSFDRFPTTLREKPASIGWIDSLRIIRAGTFTRLVGMLLRGLFIALLLAIGSSARAQQAGESIRLTGDLGEDTYVAGGVVDAMANIDGDLVVAGARVTIGQRIGGDLIAAAGTLDLDALVDDDVRAAAGDISVGGVIGDDAILAGGNISIYAGARIRGRAWLAGGRIDIRGEIGRELKAAGGKIVFAGTVNGDVSLSGDSISLLDGAVIRGNLTYRSPREADLAAGARVEGDIRYQPVDRPAAGPLTLTAIVGIGLFLLISLLISGGIFYGIGPGLLRSTISASRAEPWKCLALGLAVFAATPVVLGIAFSLVVGSLPALVVSAIYLILLFAGFLSALFLAGDILFGLWKRERVSAGRRLGSFTLATLVVLLLGAIPLLGALLWLVLTLLGTGALSLVGYRFYIDQPRQVGPGLF